MHFLWLMGCISRRETSEPVAGGVRHDREILPSQIMAACATSLETVLTEAQNASNQLIARSFW